MEQSTLQQSSSLFNLSPQIHTNVLSLRTLHLDPQENQSFFRQKNNQKKKLQELQLPVFINYRIKKTKSVYHIKEAQQVQRSPPKASILQQASNSISVNVNILSFGKTQSERTTVRSISHFTPRVIPNLSKAALLSKQEKMVYKLKLLEKNDFRKQLAKKSKYSEFRDSQTLLRKNSLFLVNCLKTRYKDGHLSPHVGNMAETAYLMPLNEASAKKGSMNTHYHQRFEYMQEAKQRLIELKVVKSQVKRCVSSLKPQPWFQK